MNKVNTTEEVHEELKEQHEKGKKMREVKENRESLAKEGKILGKMEENLDN